MTVEFDLHVDELVEEAKESMSLDATAIRMRNQSLIDKQSKLIADAHAQCEMAIAEAHAQMKEASLAYGTALDRQFKALQESTITEDTLIDEMVHASQSTRDHIQQMTAIPPLVMDDDRLQLQIRCAAAEEKAENHQEELQALLESAAEGKLAKLQKFEDLLGKHTKVQERYSRQSKLNKYIMKESLTLHSDNAALEAKIGKVSSDYNKLKHAAKGDEDVMVGLKARMETAENELERLKRKRADSCEKYSAGSICSYAYVSI
jgi:hypothetical protein